MSPPTPENPPRSAPLALQICQLPVQLSPIELACASPATLPLRSAVAFQHTSPPPCATVTVADPPRSFGVTPVQSRFAVPPPPPVPPPPVPPPLPPPPPFPPPASAG